MTDAEMVDEIHRIIAAIAPNRETPVAPEARLVEDLGFHSLALLELAVELEEVFKLPPLDGTMARGVGNVADISRLVAQLVRDQTEQ
jgi:acyl carrier protein